MSGIIKYHKNGYTCATKIFLFGARHYEKPSTGYGKFENILLGSAYVAFSVIALDIL